MISFCLLSSQGCFLNMHYGLYRETVKAQVPSESLDLAHSAFSRTMGFKAVTIESMSLTCMNYVKRLASPAGINIKECWDGLPNSDKAWMYQIEIVTTIRGNREDVRKEINSLAVRIKQSIEEAIPEAKISIQSQLAPSPM